MKKRFFTILTALALCLSLLPTTAWAEGETEQIAVQANGAIETERELQATLNAGGTVTLTQDITLTNMLTITSTVTLDLNDHVLKMTDDGSVIAVQSNGNLTLTDSAANKTTKYFSKGENGLWTLTDDTSSKYTVTGGIITGGTFDGEVVNQGEITGGTFTGEVTNNVGSTISGGTFHGAVANIGTINNGMFTGTVTNMPDGAQGSGEGGNAGTIEGGTFNGTVINDKDCTISGGTFNERATVINNGSITGGSFEGEITGNGNVNFTDSSTPVYTVRFMADEQEYETKYVTNLNVIISRPGTNPTKVGYEFDQWGYNGTPWDFDKSVADNLGAGPTADTITLTAMWTQHYFSTISDSTPPRSDGSKLADENGAVSADETIKDGRMTGFTVDGKSLDRIDLKGLDLRLTVEDTELSLSPKAIRQLLNADAGSLTLDMPGAEMTIPQEMLRGILKQLNGKDLDISLVSDEDAMIALTPKVRQWMSVMWEQGKFLPLSVLTGELTASGEPLDWSKISGMLDISFTLEMPKIEKKSGWHKENGQWFYYEDSDKPMEPEDLLPLGGINRLGLGYMVEDENGNWVMKGLEPPTILPLPNLREETSYVDLAQDWDLPRSEDIIPEFKWVDDNLLLDFELPHFSTYLIVTRIAMPFDDVAEGSYYYDAVKWAADENIAGGTDNTHFSPDAVCTRAQLVTFLWRLAGKPAVDFLMPFTDVDEGAWYAEAVRWAASEKIVEGTTATAFEPDAIVSRAQAVTMLWRYAKHSGTDVSVGEDTNILSYTDAFDIPKWAVEAVQWACGAGVMQGSGEALMPNDSCSRAQIVTFLARAYNR